MLWSKKLVYWASTDCYDCDCFDSTAQAQVHQDHTCYNPISSIEQTQEVAVGGSQLKLVEREPDLDISMAGFTPLVDNDAVLISCENVTGLQKVIFSPIFMS